MPAAAQMLCHMICITKATGEQACDQSIMCRAWPPICWATGSSKPCIHVSCGRIIPVYLLLVKQAGEDAKLAAPVHVDIARLFAGLAVTSLREVSLTGSHPAAARTWPNRDFAAAQPMFTVEPALAEAVAANSSMSFPVPDGFDRSGQWVGEGAPGASDTAATGSSSSGTKFQPSQPLEDWDSDRGGGGWLLGPKLLVALQPSEIRTFELTVQQAGGAAAGQ